MIVLFIESDLISSKLLPERSCPQCQKTGDLTMRLRQRYAQFAAGKVYPKGVFGVVQCSRCSYTLPASRWPDDLHRTFLSLKAGYRTPIAYWKGAIRTAIGFGVGVVLLVGSLWVTGRKARADFERDRVSLETAMSQPKAGLTVVTTDGSSGVFDVRRVGRVSGNSVWLRTYTGSRKLTNYFTETGWNDLTDSDFEAEGTPYSKVIFAQKGLKRSEDEADKSKHYEGYIVAILK